MGRRAGIVGVEEAFQHYCSFGEGNRNISKLRRHLLEHYGPERTPSIQALHNWSSRNNWVERAKEYDEQLGQRTRDLALNWQAEQRWDAAKELYKVAELSIERLQDVIPKMPATVQSAQTLKDIAIDAIKAAEVISGRVSDRTEDQGKAREYAGDPEEFLRKIEAVAKKVSPTKH